MPWNTYIRLRISSDSICWLDEAKAKVKITKLQREELIIIEIETQILLAPTYCAVTLCVLLRNCFRA